jgi:hypothetical protein
MAEYLPPEVSSVIDLVDTYLKWTAATAPDRGHERYHPSAWGQCLRKMQYQRYVERGWLTAAPEEHAPFLLRIFGNGHSMHDRWRSYFEGLGILKGYWKCQNPACAFVDKNGNIDNSLKIDDLMADPGHFLKLRREYGRDELHGVFRPEKCVCGWNKFHYDEISVVDEQLNFYGHADMILDFSRFDPDKLSKVPQSYKIADLPNKPVVVDMKSCNHFDFQEVAKGNPHSYYEVQLMVYANILKCDYGILIYENKNNQRTAAFRVDRNEDTLWPQIRQQAIDMNDMVEVIDENGQVHHLLPPPRPAFQDSKDCSYCQFKDICHASSIWEDPELQKKRKEFYGDLI